MEGGIEDNLIPDINNPEYRYDIYLCWKSSQRNTSWIKPEMFARNKGIPIVKLGEIVREFDEDKALRKE